MHFRTEEQSDAGSFGVAWRGLVWRGLAWCGLVWRQLVFCRGECLPDERGCFRQTEERLLWATPVERAGADDQGGVADRLGKSVKDLRMTQQLRRADGGFGFHPVGGEGGDDGEAFEAEVGHSARGSADVERVARRDEKDVEVIALECRQQALIVASADSAA